MNIAYFGSPEISALLLDSLLKHKDPSLQIVYVFTQPDRPVGKRLQLTATPVKQTAKHHNIPVFDRSLRENEKEAAAIIHMYDIQLGIVYAYGEIISKQMLSMLSYGYLNLHPSNLPKYRGPAPVAYTLMLGDKTTAISVIKLTEKMDSGPLVVQKEIDIFENENREELEKRLTHLSPPIIQEAVHISQNHPIVFKSQDEDKATYTHLLMKDNGYIPLDLLEKGLKNQTISSHELPSLLKDYVLKYGPKGYTHKYPTNRIIYNYFRALYPWPGIWTNIPTKQGNKRLKITLLSIKKDALVIERVQLEGKKEVDFKTFNSAYNIIKIK